MEHSDKSGKINWDVVAKKLEGIPEQAQAEQVPEQAEPLVEASVEGEVKAEPEKPAPRSPKKGK